MTTHAKTTRPRKPRGVQNYEAPERQVRSLRSKVAYLKRQLKSASEQMAAFIANAQAQAEPTHEDVLVEALPHARGRVPKPVLLPGERLASDECRRLRRELEAEQDARKALIDENDALTAELARARQVDVREGCIIVGGVEYRVPKTPWWQRWFYACAPDSIKWSIEPDKSIALGKALPFTSEAEAREVVRETARLVREEIVKQKRHCGLLYRKDHGNGVISGVVPTEQDISYGGEAGRIMREVYAAVVWHDKLSPKFQKAMDAMRQWIHDHGGFPFPGDGGAGVMLSSSEIETLMLLYKTPVKSGDLPSKTVRDSLVNHGLATRYGGKNFITNAGVEWLAEHKPKAECKHENVRDVVRGPKAVRRVTDRPNMPLYYWPENGTCTACCEKVHRRANEDDTVTPWLTFQQQPDLQRKP